MALIDRLFHDDPDENRHIANHEWSAALWFWSKSKVTKAQVISLFKLDATDQIQLGQLETHYNGLTTAKKTEFHSDLEAAGILAESGRITKAMYRTFLGLS